MKGLTFVLAMLVSAPAFATTHPASQFVKDTISQGIQILSLKSDEARLRGMCSLLRQKVGTSHIGGVWLGQYANLSRDASAVRQFYAMVPSIMITKAFKGMNGKTGEVPDVTVNDNASPRGSGLYAVSITVKTSDSTYRGKAIVQTVGRSFNLIDIEYMGFSAVNYLGRDYHSFLDREYQRDPNRSMPVSALVQNIKSDDGYIACP